MPTGKRPRPVLKLALEGAVPAAEILAREAAAAQTPGGPDVDDATPPAQAQRVGSTEPGSRGDPNRGRS